MRQGWVARVCAPVFAPHFTRSEICGVVGETPESVIPKKTSTFAPIIADVTGISFISDGRFARACACA